MLLDLRNRTFYIVNVESNKLICQFFVIKPSREDNRYVAIFNLTDDGDFIEIISGQQTSISVVNPFIGELSENLSHILFYIHMYNEEQ